MNDQIQEQPNLVSYSQFSQLDIRVGKVISAEYPEWSEKLIKLVVSFGEYTGDRVFFSGIRAFYQPEDLLNKQYMFVLNIEPKKMGPEMSQGMMIMAETAEKPVLFEVPESILPGSQIR